MRHCIEYLCNGFLLNFFCAMRVNIVYLNIRNLIFITR